MIIIKLFITTTNLSEIAEMLNKIADQIKDSEFRGDNWELEFV